MKVKRIVISIDGKIQNEITVEPSPEQVERRRQEICEAKKRYTEGSISSDLQNQ